MPAPAPRLLLIGPTWPFRGGIAHHTTLLYRALSRRFPVTFLSFRRQYIQRLFPGATDRDNSDDAIRVDGVRRDLDVLAPWTFLRAGRQAAGYDAVILPWWVAVWAPYYGLLLAALRGRTRVLFLCHNVAEHEPGRLKRAATAAVLRRGDAFLVQSEAERRNLERVVGTGKPIAVSPHPSYDVFDAGRYDRTSARIALDLPADAEVALFFGFVRPYKGLDLLLEAFSRLAASRPRAQLLVVGECWQDEQRYRRMVTELGLGDRCRLVLEYVPNEAVEAYVKAADVMVLPYRSGTGSGIAQIAFGMNTPVIATDIPAFAGVVRPGETGLLVAPDDPAALTAALAEAFDPDRNAAMRAAVAGDRHRFSWDAMAEAIARLLGAHPASER